jgi:putative membrane protein
MSASALLSLADLDFDGHMDWDGGWWIVMALGMVIFWGLVIAGIVWLVRELSDPRRQAGEQRESDPLALLDLRLAEGSITPDEYRERRAILTDGPSAAD